MQCPISFDIKLISMFNMKQQKTIYLYRTNNNIKARYKSKTNLQNYDSNTYFYNVMIARILRKLIIEYKWLKLTVFML